MPTACSSKGSITNAAWFQLSTSHMPDGTGNMIIRTTGNACWIGFGDSAPTASAPAVGDPVFEMPINTVTEIIGCNPRKAWFRSTAATNAAVNTIFWW